MKFLYFLTAWSVVIVKNSAITQQHKQPLYPVVHFHMLCSVSAFWEKVIVPSRIISQILWKSLCGGVCFSMNIIFLSFWLDNIFWCHALWFKYRTWELIAHNCSVSTSGCSHCNQHLLWDIWCVREKCIIIICESPVYGKHPCHWLLRNIDYIWHSHDCSGSKFHICLISDFAVHMLSLFLNVQFILFPAALRLRLRRKLCNLAFCHKMGFFWSLSPWVYFSLTNKLPWVELLLIVLYWFPSKEGLPLTEMCSFWGVSDGAAFASSSVTGICL